MGTFTPKQADQSSTAREMRGYAAAIDAATRCFPDSIKGSSILITGNNQGAISALNEFMSPVPDIHESLDKVFQLCLKYDFDVVARWVPREDLTEADELSGRPDASDWGINPNLFNQICAWFGVARAIDLFASSSHHVVDKYLSRFYTPGCAGVHALKLDWSQIVSPHDVAWIFPPTKVGSQVVSLIQQFKIDALLCVPALVGSNELIQIRSYKRSTSFCSIRGPSERGQLHGQLPSSCSNA
jgi:hypothetical protein